MRAGEKYVCLRESAHPEHPSQQVGLGTDAHERMLIYVHMGAGGDPLGSRLGCGMS